MRIDPENWVCGDTEEPLGARENKHVYIGGKCGVRVIYTWDKLKSIKLIVPQSIKMNL